LDPNHVLSLTRVYDAKILCKILQMFYFKLTTCNNGFTNNPIVSAFYRSYTVIPIRVEITEYLVSLSYILNLGYTQLLCGSITQAENWFAYLWPSAQASILLAKNFSMILMQLHTSSSYFRFRLQKNIAVSC